MLCAFSVDTLYKQQINRTFIEHKEKKSIKKLKKMEVINNNVSKFKNRPLWF